MTTETKQTGATITDEQLKDLVYAIKDATTAMWVGTADDWYESCRNALANALTKHDQCIVPRSFIEAVDAAIDEAEELDYHKLIPLKQWEAVQNARDAFKGELK